MSNELDLEQVAALLSGSKKAPQDEPKELKTHFIRRYIHYPSRNTDYIRYKDATLRCASRGCSTPTNCLFKGIPYCTIHILYAASVELDRLENEVKRLNGTNTLNATNST